MAKAIFILKRREDYNSDPSYGNSYQIATGMWNSAMFVSQMLQDAGHQTMVEMVEDANAIDAIVTLHNPEYVFIEGLWVTPAKMQELLAIPRHMPRKWVVRIHSEIPFLATEGIAMEWIAGYLNSLVYVAPNSPRAYQQLKHFAAQMDLPDQHNALDLVRYLPNSYPLDFEPIGDLDTSSNTVLDIACFGAFRPLKNHLQQVFIASRFAQELGVHLRFHVNNRTDNGGTGPARNVRAAIENMHYELVEHEWEDRETFLESLRNIDLLLQVSMSETFNIVAADATYVGKPILVSDEVSWAGRVFADPQSVDKSLEALRLIWSNKAMFIQNNRRGLRRYVDEAKRRWSQFVV